MRQVVTIGAVTTDNTYTEQTGHTEWHEYRMKGS